MSARQRQSLTVTSIVGRDGSTSSDLAIPPHRAKEVLNCDFYRASIGRKRSGCKSVFSETSSEAFTGQICALGSYIPGADPTAAQLWGIDNAGTPVVQRLAPGTTWSSPTLKDNLSGNAQDAVFVTFQGKLYIFYNSAVDRLHVWDGSTVRRVGLATPAAATVADTGSGTYAAVLRYYKIIYTDGTASGSRWSEASASVSFTPSGSGTHARITKPSALSEGETHWKIYASIDDVLYFLLTTIVVGTTTYDDITDYSTVASLSGNDPIPVVGTNIAPFSAKYGMVDGNRMLMGGSWESQNSSRVWFTPRMGASDYSDSERVPDTVDFSNWADVNEKDGDSITGLGGPIQGMPIVFKNRHIYKLRPTLDATEPYAPLQVSTSVGSLRHHSIVMAEDERGDPALYFLSHRGPYRLGIRGLQYLGTDVEDKWALVNVDTTLVNCFSLWHEDRHQVWFYVATNASTAPCLVMVFDVKLGKLDENNNVRNGWSLFDGTVSEAICGVMFSESFAASTSKVLLPYLGSTTAATLLRGDTGELDASNPFKAYVQLPEKHLGGLRHTFNVDQVVVLGSAGPHTLQLDLSRDYGCEVRTDVVSMAAETGDQTRTQKVFEAGFQTDAKSIGFTGGDICPVAHNWTLDALEIQYELKSEVAP